MPNSNIAAVPNQKSVVDKILPWITGITMPLMIVVLSALWGVSSQMSAYAAESEVLKVRISHVEKAMLDIQGNVNKITEAVTEMKIVQSTHNALMQSEVERMKNDVKDISEFVRSHIDK